ncbi:MAG: CocE/NonD family hydrolase, partial [Phycisphaerae bacterium]|nr:CocE/NonD family hydrolase [Phycisphaerae bacterium]
VAEEDDPKLSQPVFEVIEERGVEVPMRDGVKLSTDIYRPKTDDKVPVILVRTPYKKEMSELDGKFYARRGYAVAVQDCRGRFSSPGEWEPFVNEKADGYDTIEWLAAAPWSTGKVGMLGGSYLGWVQWQALSQNPPHLTTIIPNVSPPDPFFNFPYEYGVFYMYAGIWWADIVASEATGDLTGVKMSAVSEKKLGRLLRDLPVIELDKKVLGGENQYWRAWIKNNTNNEYWARASFSEELEGVTIPVFHQSGWFDGDGIGSKLNYAALARHGKSTQKLILGPWGHTAEARRMLGDTDFGPEAAPNLPRMYLRWFDHWLKGIDNGIDREPLVSLFVMNSNKWVHGSRYPLEGTQFEKWYLTSGGSANTSKGDGRLTREAPAENPPDRYIYDPADPTPDPDFFEESEDEEKQEKSIEELKARAKKRHEQVTDARNDILVYTTEPFDEPYTFVGPVSARLYAASSAKDTDWFMRLIEIKADGEVNTLVGGCLRARFRESLSRPALLEPGQVYAYDIDLWQTGLTVQTGSKLRVEVASASFPMFSRNLNTGGHNEMETEYVAAEQTIYHDAEHPSHVLLPMIPNKLSRGSDGSVK